MGVLTTAKDFLLEAPLAHHELVTGTPSQAAARLRAFGPSRALTAALPVPVP